MTLPHYSRTLTIRLAGLAILGLLLTGQPACAARFQFTQPSNVSWSIQLSSVKRSGMRPLGSFYSKALGQITRSDLGQNAGYTLTSASTSMLHDVLGYRSATLNLFGGANADGRFNPGYSQVYTCQSDPGRISYVPVKILPTYGETTGKAVRVTLRTTYLGHRSGNGQTAQAFRLYYARPGDRTGTALVDLVSYQAVPTQSRSVTFNARVGDTFYVASYYGYYCTANSGVSGELRLEMTVE